MGQSAGNALTVHVEIPLDVRDEFGRNETFEGIVSLHLIGQEAKDVAVTHAKEMFLDPDHRDIPPAQRPASEQGDDQTIPIEHGGCLAVAISLGRTGQGIGAHHQVDAEVEGALHADHAVTLWPPLDAAGDLIAQFPQPLPVGRRHHHPQGVIEVLNVVVGAGRRDAAFQHLHIDRDAGGSNPFAGRL